MVKERIAWVDDNIETPLFDPYIDEFKENEIQIIKLKSVDGLLEELKKESQNSLSAILVDIIMPPRNYGDSITRGGLRTGIVVIDEILKDTSLRNSPIIVVTNVDDIEVTHFCKSKTIPCLKKADYFTNEFVEAVNREIQNFKRGHRI